MADEDFDEDIYGDDDEGEIDTGVQLGFMSETKNPMFAEPNWERWDGGKVGGKPVWLDSVRIPSPGDLKCVCCNSPMIFLLQIYCPLDDVEEAFHRALYIFICKKKICVDNGSVKCFRTQMSRRNDTYRYDPKAIAELPTLQTPKLCNLCGCRAPSMCSKCKKVSYCCREHQSADWKDHKHLCQVITDVTADSSTATTTADIAATTATGALTTTTAAASTITATTAAATTATAPTEQIYNASIFPEFNLSISAEVLEDLEKVDALNKSVLEATIWENAGAVEVDDCSDDEDEKDDAHLTQTDYNTALGNEASDTIYTKFMERVRRGGSNQVLRYVRWDEIEGPLIFSSTDQTTGPQGSTPIGTDLGPLIPDLGPLVLGSKVAVPMPPTAPVSWVKTLSQQRVSKGCCANCGAKRKFEFQIMPQLLHFLRVDRRTKIASTSDNMPGIPEDEESTDLGPDPQKELGSDPQKDELLLQNKAEEDLDWGTIDIYTCTDSCNVRTDSKDESAYVLEGTYTQKPLLFVRNTPKPAGSTLK